MSGGRRLEYAEAQGSATVPKITVRGRPYTGPVLEAKELAKRMRREARVEAAERAIAKR